METSEEGVLGTGYSRSPAQEMVRPNQCCTCAPCGPPKIQFTGTVMRDHCLDETSSRNLAQQPGPSSVKVGGKTVLSVEKSLTAFRGLALEAQDGVKFRFKVGDLVCFERSVSFGPNSMTVIRRDVRRLVVLLPVEDETLSPQPP
ncbi:hypothetical protein DPEC_G00178260 [Dallia pectoralis]|uniref:Uncharacterized protein n=1 Tax=Dallia pectoralis TaxID=75939 RepID=A0ACC2GF38_DALPE|nr:hypothetical protein DPEC_G00178260 [Dallia pectoralis]